MLGVLASKLRAHGAAASQWRGLVAQGAHTLQEVGYNMLSPWVSSAQSCQKGMGHSLEPHGSVVSGYC